MGIHGTEGPPALTALDGWHGARGTGNLGTWALQMSFELLGVAHYCTASPGWFGICTVLYCTVVTVLVPSGLRCCVLLCSVLVRLGTSSV